MSARFELRGEHGPELEFPPGYPPGAVITGPPVIGPVTVSDGWAVAEWPVPVRRKEDRTTTEEWERDKADGGNPDGDG